MTTLRADRISGGRTTAIKIVLSPEELERVRQGAQRAGQSMSSFVRHAALEAAKERPEPVQSRDATVATLELISQLLKQAGK